MSDDRFQNKYRIESARASWHDYDGGSYFITICTKNRERFFGEIVDGEMVLSDIGKYTQKCIEEITQHNPYAEIPQFVIMPNHVHLIVIITAPDGRDVPWRVSTGVNVISGIYPTNYRTVSARARHSVVSTPSGSRRGSRETPRGCRAGWLRCRPACPA